MTLVPALQMIDTLGILPAQARRALALIVLPTIFACGSDSGSRASGIANLDDVPALELREVQRIGSVEDPDYGFSRVGAMDVDHEGNLYVFESRDLELRVYAPDGSLINRISGRGEGPGELTGSSINFGVKGDTVWLLDRFPRRLALFDRQGTLLSTSLVDRVSVPMHNPGSSSVISPRWMDADGLVVGERSLLTPSSEPGGPDTVDLPRIRFGTDGTIVDTAGSYPIPRTTGSTVSVTVGQSGYFLPSPPSTTSLIIPGPNGWIRIDRAVAGKDNALRILRFSSDGDTLSDRILTHEPQGFPDEVLDAAARRATHVEGSMTMLGADGTIQQVERRASDSSAARAEVRRRMDWPAVQSPVRSYEVTTSEALWLKREDPGGDMDRWTILGEDDLPRGEVVIPKDVRISVIRGDTVWTVESDELGIPWVVRYQLERMDAG